MICDLSGGDIKSGVFCFIKNLLPPQFTIISAFVTVLPMYASSFYVFSSLFLSLFCHPYWEKTKRNFNNLDKVQQWITYCKCAKVFGLTTSLLSVGLAFNSNDENFAKSTTSLALIGGLIGISSEGIRDLLLEPQEEKLKDIEQRKLIEKIVRELKEQENQLLEAIIVENSPTPSGHLKTT